MYLVSEADGDAETADTVEEVEHGWHTPGFNPETDAFVVENNEKEIVGFWEVFDGDEHAQLELDGYVHPDYKDTPVADMLIRRAEERAMEHIPLAAPERRVFIRSAMSTKDKYFQAFHEKSGYTAVRYFWRMEIKLEQTPELHLLADGLEFRPFIKEEHARLVWEADNEAFRDHWGSHDSKFEEWHQRKLERPEFDPSLWLIVWDGDQIAGFSQNRYLNEIGWVGTLGVRRPWRQKGLGLTLLTHSFAEFYKRGTKTIGLGVDSANPTGATRLYQKAGMSAVNEYVAYEKELRAGESE
ncbi:MAG: GNAT family N-acetyltransferase [Anaerolineales bacterium]|nr:GNAT family N-acetyltransferase [Anaerolineales bacterium]